MQEIPFGRVCSDFSVLGGVPWVLLSPRFFPEDPLMRTLEGAQAKIKIKNKFPPGSGPESAQNTPVSLRATETQGPWAGLHVAALWMAIKFENALRIGNRSF
jgi:hypothetical protein